MAIDMDAMLAKIKDRQWALADIDWDAPGAETISDEFRPKLKAFMADLCWIENVGARGFAGWRLGLQIYFLPGLEGLNLQAADVEAGLGEGRSRLPVVLVRRQHHGDRQGSCGAFTRGTQGKRVGEDRQEAIRPGRWNSSSSGQRSRHRGEQRQPGRPSP